MQQTIRIAPSILSADFAQARRGGARRSTAAGADYIHVDVMDGHFVPNLTIGPAVVKALRPHSKLPFDVHLMISPVDPYHRRIRRGRRRHHHRPSRGGAASPPHASQLIKSLGKKAGVALNPATPVEARRAPCSGELDLVLVMTVNPGFGGQSFIAAQLDKIRALRAAHRRAGPRHRSRGRWRHQRRDRARGGRRRRRRAGRRHGELRRRRRRLCRQHPRGCAAAR